MVSAHELRSLLSHGAPHNPNAAFRGEDLQTWFIAGTTHDDLGDSNAVQGSVTRCLDKDLGPM